MVREREHRPPRRDEQRHTRRSHASTIHHRGDQASFAGEMSVTRAPSNHDAAGDPPSTSTRYNRTPHPTGTQGHRRHHHREQGYASAARHGTATTRRRDGEQASFAQDLSVTHPSPPSVVDTELRHGNNVATSTTTNRSAATENVLVPPSDVASFGSFVLDTIPSAAAAVSHASRNDQRHLEDAGDFQPSTPTRPHRSYYAGTSTAPPYASMYYSTNQDASANVTEVASFAEQRSVTRAPADGMGDPMGVAYGSGNRIQDDGEPKPMSPGVIPLYGEFIASNEEEEHPPPSSPDVELGRNDEDETRSVDDAQEEEIVEEVHTEEVDQDVDESVHPGAIAVPGPGGPTVASGASASHQQQPEEDADEVPVRAELVGADDPLRVLQALEERMDRMENRVENNQQNRPPVVVAESMPIQVQPAVDEASVGVVQDHAAPNLQQHGEANGGIFHWIKAKKSRMCIGIACLVLAFAVVVVVMGIALGRSSSNGGSPDSSQTTTAGPTPELTAAPEVTLEPTPPPTLVHTTPAPTPPATTPPTPPPTTPPTPPPTTPPTPPPTTPPTPPPTTPPTPPPTTPPTPPRSISPTVDTVAPTSSAPLTTEAPTPLTTEAPTTLAPINPMPMQFQ